MGPAPPVSCSNYVIVFISAFAFLNRPALGVKNTKTRYNYKDYGNNYPNLVYI
jgi:hypothetical protein